MKQNNNIHPKSFLASCLLASVVIDSQFNKINAQTKIKYIEPHQAKPTKLFWKPVTGPETIISPQMTWGNAQGTTPANHKPTTTLIWKLLDTNDSRYIAPPDTLSKPEINPPTSGAEFEALKRKIMLKQRQTSLSGLTVNTAFVPPAGNYKMKVNAVYRDNVNASFGYSISDNFQIEVHSSILKKFPRSPLQSQIFAKDSTANWHGSAKAVITSPLRGAPIWSAIRISLGRNMDIARNTVQDYLFTEAPLSWEATPSLVLNLDPKIVSSRAGTLWGMGTSSNIQLSPRWELIPEANIVLNSIKESNGTLGLRLNATKNIAFEIYGSTASSNIDMGQLLNAGKVHWGSRLRINF